VGDALWWRGEYESQLSVKSVRCLRGPIRSLRLFVKVSVKGLRMK